MHILRNTDWCQPGRLNWLVMLFSEFDGLDGGDNAFNTVGEQRLAGIDW